MQWMGKLIGGVVGMALGPWGAAIGAAIGHQYDLNEERRGARPPAEQFFVSTFRTMGHVAKADGRVTEVAAGKTLLFGEMLPIHHLAQIEEQRNLKQDRNTLEREGRSIGDVDPHIATQEGRDNRQTAQAGATTSSGGSSPSPFGRTAARNADSSLPASRSSVGCFSTILPAERARMRVEIAAAS